MTPTLDCATRWGRHPFAFRGGVAMRGRPHSGAGTDDARTDRRRFCPVFEIRRLLPSAFCLLLFLGVAGCHRDIERSLGGAVEAWDSGDYSLAAEEYERYLSQRPSSDKAPEARFQLANIYYFKLRRYDQARDHYNAFLEQNPSHSNAQVARERLAEVLGEMGSSYEAIEEYDNLSTRDSGERRRIRLRIADLYFSQRNYSQALTEYEKVIEQVAYDELSEQAYLREASIYHIARGQYKQGAPGSQTRAYT